MLELILLTVLSRNIAARARDKGRSGTAAVMHLLALWFIGTVGGLSVILLLLALWFIGAVGDMRAMNAFGANLLLSYCGSLIGGIVGASVAFAMVAPDTSHAPPAAGTWRGTAGGRRQRLLVIVVLLGAILGAAAVVTLCNLPPAPPVPPADLVVLQGDWVLERIEVNGKASRSRLAGKQRAKITGEQIRFNESSNEKFHIDREENPARLGVDGLQTICIYRREGKCWVFCSWPGGRSRPTWFETRPDSNTFLFVYRRSMK